MEAETPSSPSCGPEVAEAEDELNSTIHGFNQTNITVIEKGAGDGSDSGVEDAFDILLGRKNSNTMLQDLKDSGSETSSTCSGKKKETLIKKPTTTVNKKPCTPRPSTLKTASTSASASAKIPQNKPRVQRSASTTRAQRTPVMTPTGDGRWPNMTRSFRATSETKEVKEVKSRVSLMERSCATLPRRRREREKSADNVKEPVRKSVLPPFPKKKTRIFAETLSQTTLTLADITRMIDSGTVLERGERTEVAVQTDDNLKQQIQLLQEELEAERREKLELQAQLERNMQRVQSILNKDNHESEGEGDSLLELESRFSTAGQIIIKQENEISELHNFCRALQRELDASNIARQHLQSAQQDLEHESHELQEFLAAEKWALCEALAEAEARGASAAAERARLRHEALTLEGRSRDLLLAQGAAVSGAAVALSGLAHRLDTLTHKLAQAYSISDQHLDELDDDIYHNEAYNPDTPDSPQQSLSFISAVISAIRNTVTENLDDNSCEDLLDSETEPCLMMENVLEDVVHVDTHSHNLVSEPGASASSLVDQVIEADNLLTRLLKVLRVIQRVQDSEAASLREDLQQHRKHVERLSHDVCALSTACSTQQGEDNKADAHAHAPTAQQVDVNV